MLKVTNFKKIDKKGLIAVFDVDVNGVEARKCKLCQFNGQYNVVGPSEKYFSQKENKDKFYDLVRFSDEIKNKVLDVTLKLAGVDKSSEPDQPSDEDIPF